MAKIQPRGRPAGMGRTAVKTTRASISLPLDLRQTLEQIAIQKKVSFAWVMREAAEKYVADQWPLFEGRQ